MFVNVELRDKALQELGWSCYMTIPRLTYVEEHVIYNKTHSAPLLTCNDIVRSIKIK